MSLPGLISTTQAAPLLGFTPRHVSRLVRDGWFPRGVVVPMGRGKQHERVRLSLQRLIDAGLVTADAAQRAQAAP